MLSKVQRAKLLISTRTFATRQASSEVQIHGFKITAATDSAMGQVQQGAEEKSVNTLLFLHGLLGQGRGWRQFALNDMISRNRDLFLIDLRNHGESDHHASMNYEEMADDIIRFADARDLEDFTVLGHNIGAKTAMVLAQNHPSRVRGMISLDTAPVSSSQNKDKTLATIDMIMSLPIEGLARKGAIDLINQNFSDKGIANFVANNLAYTSDDDHKSVSWAVNLQAIKDNIDSLVGYPETKAEKYLGPSFFLNGSLSVKYEQDVYLKEFPSAKVVEIEGAGHYPHIDKGQTTVRLIGECLHLIETQSVKL